MKYWWFGLVCFLFGSPVVEAFYSSSELIRTERRIEVQSVGADQLEVTLIDTVQNPTATMQDLQYYYPFPGHVSEVQFFVDARGEPFEVISGTERLSTLFDQAALTRDARFFRLGANPYQELFRSRAFEIEAESSVTLKLKWRMSADFVDDFFFSEIFTDDGIMTERYEVIISLASSERLWHFFQSMESQAGMIERDPYQLVWLWESEQYQSQDNLRFFWSTVERPVLEYSTDDAVYYGHFDSWGTPRRPEEVILLIDTSGSMGLIWDRVTQVVSFALERVLDTSIKVAFFDGSLRWFDSDFSVNDHDFVKKLMTRIDTLKPLGKGSIAEGLKLLDDGAWHVPRDDRAIVLVTDQDLRFLPPETVSAPVIGIDFSESGEGLSLISSLTGGFSQRMFRAASGLIEGEEFFSRWQDWRYPKQVSSIVPIDEEVDVLPNAFSGKFAAESPIFVGRRFDTYASGFGRSAGFLPRRWGALRIAQILREQVLNARATDAILSIARRFGIQTDFFDHQISQKLLELKFRTTRPYQIAQMAHDLERDLYPLHGGIRLYQDVPLYFQSVDKVWQSFDFLERVRPSNLVAVSPFSEAQKQLFLKFPSLVGQAFGAGDLVEFCMRFRCFSVRYGYRELAVPEDRAFLVDYDPGHWANPYVSHLIDQGVFRATANGKIHADRPVDRGEFVRMVYELNEQLVMSNEQLGTPIFSDVEEGSEFYEAVQSLVQQGIIKGYPDGTFRPYLGLSRAEAIKVLLAAQGWRTSPQTPLPKGEGLIEQELIFSDVTGWARSWVEEAYHRGLVRGFGDGKFRPNDKLTRASAVKLLVESMQ